MKKVINCNQNNNPLINKKAKEVSVEEGLVIAEELFQILNKRGDGIGLAANQVGIDAQVAVVNVTEPLVLINPKYIHKEFEIMYGEGCLSYPGLFVKIRRPEWIEVEFEDENGEKLFQLGEIDVLKNEVRDSDLQKLMLSIIQEDEEPLDPKD